MDQTKSQIKTKRINMNVGLAIGSISRQGMHA
jgi:hypothetical protein